MIRPLYLFSLPRSGSTLLQRVLASHEEVHSVAEPWLLLPLIYPLRASGMYTEYDHKQAHIGLTDFCSLLPERSDSYLQAVGRCAQDLYQQAAGVDSGYFLDKTPRYALICEEVFRAVPDAKYIFVWRNPLAIVASLIETWGRGRWLPFYFRADLHDGLRNLVATYERHCDQAIAVRYEDFVAEPEKELKRLCEYLGIEFRSEMISKFSEVEFKGIQGDPTGRKAYSTLAAQPLVKWKHTICNPWRKYWCRRYLAAVGRARLATMGYDLDLLVEELDGLPVGVRSLFVDLMYAPLGMLNQGFTALVLAFAWREYRSRLVRKVWPGRKQ